MSEKYRFIRRPRTTSEKRANQNSPYVRAKCRPHNLPDSYDDIKINYQKNWKCKRNTQYENYN